MEIYSKEGQDLLVVLIFGDYNVSTCEGATIAVDEFFSNKKEVVEEKNNNFYVKKI